MSQWDFQLLSSIVSTKRLQHALNKGISVSSFASTEAQVVFEFLVDFASRSEHYGEVASEKLVCERFPTLPFPKPDQGTDALIALVKRDYLGRSLANHLEQVAALLDDDPIAALAAYVDSSKLIAEVERSDDVDLTLDLKNRIAIDYARIQAGGGVGLWPWPWPELTGGIGMIEPGTLNVFWGIPKSGKTWISLLICTMAYLQWQRRVVIYSPEMRREQLERRIACIIGRVDYELYREGRLPPEDLKRFFDVLDYLQTLAKKTDTHERLILLNGLGKTKASSTLKDLCHKVEQYEPDLIFMDSAYHAASGVDWKLITDLSRGVKRLSNDTGIPSLAVIQENERMSNMLGPKARGTASIAMGPSWAQDFDSGFRVVNTGDDHVLIQASANREAKTAGKGIRIHFKPGGDFSFVDYNVKDPSETAQDQAQQQPRTRLPVGKLLAKPKYG